MNDVLEGGHGFFSFIHGGDDFLHLAEILNGGHRADDLPLFIKDRNTAGQV